jgi:hypothetical protein
MTTTFGCLAATIDAPSVETNNSVVKNRAMAKQIPNGSVIIQFSLFGRVFLPQGVQPGSEIRFGADDQPIAVTKR